MVLCQMYLVIVLLRTWCMCNAKEPSRLPPGAVSTSRGPSYIFPQRTYLCIIPSCFSWKPCPRDAAVAVIRGFFFARRGVKAVTALATLCLHPQHQHGSMHGLYQVQRAVLLRLFAHPPHAASFLLFPCFSTHMIRQAGFSEIQPSYGHDGSHHSHLSYIVPGMSLPAHYVWHSRGTPVSRISATIALALSAAEVTRTLSIYACTTIYRVYSSDGCAREV